MFIKKLLKCIQKIEREARVSWCECVPYYNISNSPHIYVFRYGDHEYNSENWRLANFHGENHENHSFWRLSQPICKTSQNVPSITSRIYQNTHIMCNKFFNSTNIFRKIRWKILWHETLPRIGRFFSNTVGKTKFWFSVFVATFVRIQSNVLTTDLWNFYHLFFVILSIFLGIKSTIAKK